MCLDVYRKNQDIYIITAERIFGEKIEKGDERRDLTKTLWLGSQYGAFPPKLARTMCLNGFPTTEKEVAALLEELRRIYSTLYRWRDYVIREAKDKGFVKTIGGRYRRLKALKGHAPWKVQSRAERQAVNAIIQGSAADILRRNMLATSNRMFVVRLLAQVHDELVWEYDPELARRDVVQRTLKNICEDPGYELGVPLQFDPVFCTSWAGKDDPGQQIELGEEVA